ncbi:unnamed protein product [Ambrosiozyma monospora]|uniref:Unnamed protein product n=1 Tax=Ambrosiozyma monospora TaxID=43982 RepID=A0ACB5T6K5_AMBMO|nr:unnamed protein product [Ambrosiozyma monospora]
MLSFSLEFGVLFKKGAICEFSTKFPTLDSVLSSHHNALCLHAGQYSVKPGFTGNLFKRVYEDITGGTSTPSSVGTSPDTNELFCEPSAKTTTLPEEPIKKYDCRGDNSFIRSVLWWILEILPVGHVSSNQHTGIFKRVYKPHLSKPREMPETCKVHWSLLWRAKFIKDHQFKNLPKIYNDLVSSLRNHEINSSDSNSKTIIDDNVFMSAAEQLESGFNQDDLIDCRSGVINVDAISDCPSLQVFDWQKLPDELEFWITQHTAC